ncbi:MAG: biotin/lipoyl-binding protein [Pseudolabrys sp.]
MKPVRTAAIARLTMRRVNSFRRVQGRRGEELAFLPAALEIVETPPSPVGRAIGATIILLFCVALIWASVGTIDIVASATGKIVPSGRTKVIQPFETGVVRSIRVQDGQAVKAGDVLIELDPTVNAADRDHLNNDRLAEQLNIARLRAALAGDENSAASFAPPAEAFCIGQRATPVTAQPGCRAPRQDCGACPSAGAERSGAGHYRGHNP